MTKQHILMALSMICGVGAAIGVFASCQMDFISGAILMFCCMQLMSFLAGLTFGWRGFIAIAAVSILFVASDEGDRFGTSDIPAWVEWGEDILLMLLLGIMGFVIGLLFRHLINRRKTE